MTIKETKVEFKFHDCGRRGNGPMSPALEHAVFAPLLKSGLTEADRKKLYKLYIQLQECKSEIESIARRTANWHNSKAYWFASLSSAINDDEYPNMTSTMKSFLVAEGVMGEDGKFIEPETEANI